MEKIKQSNNKDSIYFIRHSESEYNTNKKILKSENPQASFDLEKQIMPDLSKKGKELAKQEAENFFSGLDPKSNVLFFASSSQVRAIETANIYREIAKEKGFEITKPVNTRNEIAEEIGEGEIRAIQNLSININNVFAQNVFKPEKYIGDINWEAIDEDTKKKWIEARKIINGDDKGSWGANFFHHSEKIQEIFPEVETAKELYATQFKNILRLIKFADRKIEEANFEKNIKILSFGHENYLAFALDKYFNSHEIKNCETISIKVDNDDILFKYRDSKEKIN